MAIVYAAANQIQFIVRRSYHVTHHVARDSGHQRRREILQQHATERGSQRRGRYHQRMPRAEDLDAYLGREKNP